MAIDWTDLKAQISPHFTVHDATYLPTWGVHHGPSDVEKDNILKTAEKLELIREYLGDHPVNVNCWIRPMMANCPGTRFDGKNYNLMVGGAVGSAHIRGLACDFTVSTITCNEVRAQLESKLEEFNIRMEKKLNASWIHVDLFPANPNRYFIP